MPTWFVTPAQWRVFCQQVEAARIERASIEGGVLG